MCQARSAAEGVCFDRSTGPNPDVAPVFQPVDVAAEMADMVSPSGHEDATDVE